MREERQSGLERAVAAHALQELREEEERREHGAGDEHARGIGTRPLAAGEQVQRRDRLLGTQLGEGEAGEQPAAAANEASVPWSPQPSEAARTKP